MKLILIRHGKPEFPSGDYYFMGRTDWPLCADGRMQAAQTAKRLNFALPDVIYCSPLLRCRETADIVFAGKAARREYVDGLMEIDMGKWEGLSEAEVDRRYPGEFDLRGVDMGKYRPPEGETFYEVQQRALNALRALPKAETCVAVTHWGVISTLSCYFAGQPLKELLSYRDSIEYASINVLDVPENF